WGAAETERLGASRWWTPDRPHLRARLEYPSGCIFDQEGEFPLGCMTDPDERLREICARIRKLWASFRGPYWRELDREVAYPSEFVSGLTREGYLSVLIPEEYGGSGLGLGAATAI